MGKVKQRVEKAFSQKSSKRRLDTVYAEGKTSSLYLGIKPVARLQFINRGTF